MNVLTKGELWGLLGRCRRVIQRIVQQRCAMPLDAIDEMQALDDEFEHLAWPGWTHYD